MREALQEARGVSPKPPHPCPTQQLSGLVFPGGSWSGPGCATTEMVDNGCRAVLGDRTAESQHLQCVFAKRDFFIVIKCAE